MKYLKIIHLLMISLLLSNIAYANQTENLVSEYQSLNLNQANIHLDKIAQGLDVPWSIATLSTNHLLVAQKQGLLWLVDVQSGKKNQIKGLPKIANVGQGGLLDLVLSPKQTHEKNISIFFTYSKSVAKNKAATTLATAQIDLERLLLVNIKDLLVSKSESNKGQHFGSRITFDSQGHVYFSVGDRGDRDNGQDLTNHASTIIRLNLDGTAVKDNPFVSQKNALNEIYSYGHRNPQGLEFDATRNILWSIEHGPRGGDEINIIQAGHNYGWPEVSFGKEYWGPKAVGTTQAIAGMTMPKKVYIPSIAPSSLMLYQGDEFPMLKGNLLAGALAKKHLNVILLDDKGNITGELRLLESLNQRVRSISQNAKGHIFVGLDSGDIYRLSHKK